MKKQQENKRTFKTNSIADIARKINDRAFRRYGFARSDIHLHWHDIVGSVLAAASLPERLIMPKNETNEAENRGGVLHIRVEGSFAPEMQHMQPLVIDRINSYYGFKAVERLIFNHGPVENSMPSRKHQIPILTDSQKKQLEQLLYEIKDDRLRESLYKVGTQLMGDVKMQKTKQIKRFTRRGLGDDNLDKGN